MKTRRFCPHCGRPLLKSQIKEYAFQCFCCDEDYYRFEVLRKKNLGQVRLMQRETAVYERQNEYTPQSVRKPYPRPAYSKK